MIHAKKDEMEREHRLDLESDRPRHTLPISKQGITEKRDRTQVQYFGEEEDYAEATNNRGSSRWSSPITRLSNRSSTH